MKKNIEVAAAVSILVCSLFVAGIIFAHAQTSSDASSTIVSAGTEGITFPIPELGNCADKDACRAYCNDPANMDAFISFAKAHGLMNKDDADRATKFREKLLAN